MGLPDLDANAPGIIATQSTHKQLASFSQASQIHVKDSHIRGQNRRVEHRRFNESFLQYASTSPFYPLFASLDVGAQMMKGRSGEVLWDDTIRLGIELRRNCAPSRQEFERRESDPARRWFFDPFVPDRGPAAGPRSASAACTKCRGKASPPMRSPVMPTSGNCRRARPWHGFGQRPARLCDNGSEQVDAFDAGLQPRPPARTRRAASRPPSLPNICARTASWRKNSISTRCCSCSRRAWN